MLATSKAKAWRRWQPSPSQPWDVRRVVHLHRRAGFGTTWAALQRDLHDGCEAALDRILRPQTPGSAPAGAPSDFEQMSAVIGDAAVSSENIDRLEAWWIYRMLLTPDPLHERLTLMWHNHFATSNLKIADVGLMRQQHQTIRSLADGSFAQLLREMAKDPALLLWLDADANRKEHPNENLAREIMELFSLGVGNYAEHDVKEAARALTGWSVKQGSFRYITERHDSADKTIFRNTGPWKGDDLLEMLIEHPATSRRVAFRVCELLMGEGTVDESMLEALATGLRDNDLDIHWAIATVLRSEEFFSDANLKTRVMSPTEFVVGTARALELVDPPPSTLLLAEWTARLGQELFYPPNVFGWPGGRAWLTSRALIGRANFASDLLSGRLTAEPSPFAARALAERHGLTRPQDVGTFFAQLLLGLPELPARLGSLTDSPHHLVSALLASAEAQLG